MSRNSIQTKRSATGRLLMPASSPGITLEHMPKVPTYTLITWTFGRASIIWKIWPAVLLHTIFAAAVVTFSMTGVASLKIPTVMLTVLGVVIGFVISYRAMSGYDRYWMGRTCWSEIIRNSRTMGRLIWFHVPPRLTPKTADELSSGKIDRSRQELTKVMNEKRLALDLVQAFSVAVKHHLRGELGIYYEDLYHLVRPLHDHEHKTDHHPAPAATAKRPNRISAQPPVPEPKSTPAPSQLTASTSSLSPTTLINFNDPVIPSINAYGTFDGSTTTVDSTSMLPRHLRRVPSHSSDMSTTSEHSQHRPLLPSAQPTPQTMMDKVSGELIPFAGLVGLIKRSVTGSPSTPQLEVLPATVDGDASQQFSNRERKWRGPIHSRQHLKHHMPGLTNEGESLPLEILRCLSEWFSVLEDRGTVPGTSLGGMIGSIAAFEDNLSTLERILTTPLPFVYSVHIRHTVWLYLFFLPFQLVDQFGYYTIPGVAIAAFIYLGFFAAGEEIEQPFGYDENDLDLDLFCNEIIRVEIESLKSAPCLNAYLGHQRPKPEHRKSMTLVQTSTLQDDLANGVQVEEEEILIATS